MLLSKSVIVIVYFGIVVCSAFPEPQYDSNSEHSVDDLFSAIKSGNVKKVHDLIKDYGANAVDDEGISALQWAANKGNEELTHLLLKNGADINHRDSNKRTVLLLATLKGKPAVVQFLIENGADINATDDVGSNALHRAAEHSNFIPYYMNNVKVAEMLIKHNIDMNYKDAYGCTPLHRAAEHNNVKIAQLLVKSGADMNIIDNYNDTALRWAQIHHKDDVAEFLMNSGARRGVWY